MVADVSDRVFVALLAHRLRMDRLKRPVLARREYRIRRRPATDAVHEKFGISPRVEAVAMQAQRQIQIQQASAVPTLPSDMLQLFLNQPLGIEVAVLDALL